MKHDEWLLSGPGSPLDDTFETPPELQIESIDTYEEDGFLKALVYVFDASTGEEYEFWVSKHEKWVIEVEPVVDDNYLKIELNDFVLGELNNAKS